MPLGYGDKLSAAETDCSGLLHVFMNCQYVQKYMDRYIATPNGHFSKILNFRNKIFHSASLSLDQEDIDHHIDLMIEILQDQNTLAQDPDAQNAVGLLTQLKCGTFIVSSKDELEIRAEKQAAYQKRKLALQTSLCEIYGANFKTIPISPLLDEVEADIDDVVVDMIVCEDCHEGYLKHLRKDRSDFNLDLCEYAEENNMGKIIEDYRGIFFKDDKSCKNVYISGEAGMGKTTWCMKMLRTWVTALEKIKTDPQTDTLSVDEKVMSEFDIVLFVSLRYAVHDGNIRDMLRNHLFQEIPNLDLITSEVLEKEAYKCLVILDGFNEWSPPENCINTSASQNPEIPGHKDLHLCPVLTTTRSYKLHQVRLKERDVDKTANIQGIKDYKGFAERVINKIRREAGTEGEDDPVTYQAFCEEVERTFKKNISKVSFLRLPFILVFVLCSWLDNSKLENTWAGNFSGLLECMILAAEKRKGRLYGLKDLDDLKNKWSTHKFFLPQLFQDRRNECSNYSLLILNLSKLAFYTFFDANIKAKLFLPEVLVKKWLSTKEVEIAVKISILSQIKVVGKTLTRTSSLSFLHKTIQEHLAAVYLCSKTKDQQQALDIFNECCYDQDKMEEYEQILFNVYGMTNKQTANFVSQTLLQTYSTVFFNDPRLKGNYWWVLYMLKDFIKEMEKSYNVKLSSMEPTYIAKISDCSKGNLELKIIKTPLSFHKASDTGMEESVPETVADIEKTQTWLPSYWSPSHWGPSHWSEGVDSWTLVELIANTEDDDVIKINLSHCVNLESLYFMSMSNCDIYLSQTSLREISIERVTNCSIHINKTVESSELIQPPLNEILLNETKNCTITLSDANWKLYNVNFEKCDSCKLVIETGKLVSPHVSEIDQLCLSGESQNIQLEEEEFKLPVNHLIFTNYNLQSMRKSFEGYLHVYLWNANVVTITEMPDTEENWTTLKAAIPHLLCMHTFSLHVSVKEVGFYDDQEESYSRKIQSSALQSLQYATQLKELILTLIAPSETICIGLARALPNMIQLEIIEIVRYSDSYHNQASTSSLIQSMKWLPFLTHISIRGNHCVTFKTLPLVLPHIKKLRKLELEWYCIESRSTFEYMALKLMTSIQHVGSLREIHLTLPENYEGEPDSYEGVPDSYKGDLCLKPMPLLETLCIRNEQELPEKLLSSINNLPNLRHLYLENVSKDNVVQLYQVLPILTNLESLELNYGFVSLDFHKFIESLPKTNGTIEVRYDGYADKDNIKDATTESRRFTFQYSHVNTTNQSVSCCLLPISNEESTKVNFVLP